MALAEIQEQLAGVWILQTNENLDEYLQEIGPVVKEVTAAIYHTAEVRLNCYWPDEDASLPKTQAGVGFVMRKLAATANSTMTIAVEGEKIRISTNRPKDSQAFFALGEEFDSKDPKDNPVKAIATWENGVLFTDARPLKPGNGIAQQIERRIVDSNLEMKITVNNVTCKRIFKKKSS